MSEHIPWLSVAAAIASSLVGSLFAAADTAVTSLTSTRLSALIDQSEGSRKAAFERVQREDAGLRSRYLIGRVGCTAVTAAFLVQVFQAVSPRWALALSILVTSVVMGILFEVSTTLGRKHADRAAAAFAQWLRPLELLTLPIAVPLGIIGARIGTKAEGEAAPDPRIAEAEVEIMVEEGEKSGLFPSDPAEMIRNVLEFADLTARDVMIPRSRIEGIELATPLDAVLAIVTESGHSRYPVYQEQIDNIVGLLYAKDLFKVLDDDRLKKTTLAEIIRKPANFVAESRSLSSLLREMRSRRQHLAIVVDELGAVTGIITLEDVLEEIVGEIDDEHDSPAHRLTVLQRSGEWLLDGSLHPDEVFDACGLRMPDGDFETLAGFVLAELGRIPEVGEGFDHEGWRVEVASRDRLRVASVRLRRGAVPPQGSAS